MYSFLILVLLAPLAQETSVGTFTYRGRLTAESTATSTRIPPQQPRGGNDRWQFDGRAIAAADGTWSAGERLRIGGSFAALSGDDDAFAVRTRELYARVSPASWLDVEAGRRIVRWGVGYGFSPAGVLDPERLATDPTDRLQLNSGRLMARASLYRGPTTITVAGAERRSAARVTTVLPGGLEVSLIGAGGPGTRPQYGATMTHVIGQQLEVHAEALVHDRGARRSVSAVAGFQYTFTGGVNVVLEYHRNGRGLTAPEWEDVLRGRRNPGTRPSRQNAVFFRAARAGSDVTVSPELIVIVSPDDRGLTLVPSVTWTPRPRYQLYARVTHLTGRARSIPALSPVRSALTLGVAARF